jgi:hypothetical protein
MPATKVKILLGIFTAYAELLAKRFKNNLEQIIERKL